ncbi:MAG: DNA-directed RNA polymerase III subunit rpc25 [Peltula sp. TS41687]|nr:MAG: DNA-directed RNA polymerase III subunit rpc25 [Peltula sp. TS41687]
MFILTTISDLIQISPADFGKLSVEALEDNINAKYANKVIQNIGLCICMWDLLETSEGLIGHGTGLANVNGKSIFDLISRNNHYAFNLYKIQLLINQSCAAHFEFRLVVFRPFKGEVLLGKISSSSALGIKIRLDFFDDIFVPGNLLFGGSRFDHVEQVWVWESEGTKLYFDKNESVLFRVESEEWNDQAPAEREPGASLELKSPYCIQVSGW